MALVARASGPRDKLIKNIGRIRRQLSEQQLDAAFLLDGQRWGHYAMPEAKLDLELRLEELLHPQRVAARVAAEARRAERRKATEDSDRRRHDAIVEFAGHVERDGEAAVRKRLADLGKSPGRIAWILGQAAREKSETAKPRQSPPQPSLASHAVPRDPLPQAKGDRGLILLRVTSALACQPPMPTRIHNRKGKVAICDAQMPPLTSPDEAQTWVAQVEKMLSGALGLMAGRDTEIQALIEAAADQGYATGSPQTPVTEPGREEANYMIRLIREVEQSVGEASTLAPSALRWASGAAASLKSDLEAWQASGPSSKYRWTLALGLVAGAAVFGVGVIVPILSPGAPGWLTTSVPAYAYAVLALWLAAAAFFYVRKL